MNRVKIAHVLNRNTGSSLPKWVIFFDTETYETKIDDKTKELKLKLGYATLTRRNRLHQLYKVSEVTFTDMDTFNRWLDGVCVGRQRYYLVAHNIAFDARVLDLLHVLPTLGFTREKFIAHNINFIAHYRRGQTSLVLLNNQQLFNFSLRYLGESIGFEKLKVDFDSVDIKELEIYCRRDVDVMVQAWNLFYRFLKEHDLGNFGLTMASTSFNAFRHRFMKTDIFIHNNDKATEIEREAYHGGRTEAFFIGTYRETKVYYLDVNSMYPYVMLAKKFPVKLVKAVSRPALQDIRAVPPGYTFIIKGNFEVNERIAPVVHDNRLVFPIGKVSGAFCKPEYEEIIANGRFISGEKLLIYKEENIFEDFVKFFYAKRLEYREQGNMAFSFLSKLIMNSLYGKFGQRNTSYEVVGESKTTPDGVYNVFDGDKNEWIKLRIIDGIVERSTGTVEGFNSFPAVAAFVTSFARVELLNYIRQAGWRNVLYTDTDSVFVTESGKDNLASFIDKYDIGKLKIEEFADELTIFGAKDYVFGGHHVLKGIRKDAIELEAGHFEQDKFEGFNGALRNGRLDVVRVARVKKLLRRKYDKGIVTASGVVEPLELAMF